MRFWHTVDTIRPDVVYTTIIIAEKMNREGKKSNMKSSPKAKPTNVKKKVHFHVSLVAHSGYSGEQKYANA
jgi:hypothetical protein